MANCGTLLKSVLAAFVLVAVAKSGSAEKLASCCTSVTRTEITEPILGYLVQRPNPPCVRAVIFQTETGLFCSQVTAPWVRQKIAAFKKTQASTPSVISASPVSLLSILTSTTSPSSASSSSFPSSVSPSSSQEASSSTSKMPTSQSS
ncbi:uncharacterized protein LOC114452944 isoform X2 [Parambassis ranga]|uniref:Uncharacterized protein LOC114452944 isoform X2 n=1 Tax=Parambassis ranga TaxID=210632 RepID=A0A6P7KLL3_9TELE|nr:uncharacterized protein LOC114452944 isoform X2 [Parambassis ranga]